MITRTYTELSKLPTFEERFEYLSLRSTVGKSTFGHERYLNQRFYRSREWKRIRNHVISRDLGLDLGIEGYEIHDRVIIHHMNPITVDEVVHNDQDILDPEFLITTRHDTHNAIHYGDINLLPKLLPERHSGDTKLW